ncbi:MAG: helix-turn-helix domain-containing protein [archaeon]
MMRQNLYQKTIYELQSHGFSVETFFDSNSSFDVIARREELVLIVKILSNIDALRNEHATDLKKLARAFHAHPILIGEKSKVFHLDPHTLYERYDVPVLSIEGFEALLDSQLPLMRSFKGKNVVELDAEKLRAEREAHAYTLKSLSEKAHVSSESLHRYEHGSPADLDTAQRLEKILSTKLIRGINVFEAATYPPALENEPVLNDALEQLRDLGLKLSVFQRAPLTAAGVEEHPLLISHAETKKLAAKKAVLLKKTQRIVHQPGFILSHETTRSMDVPVVNVDELSTFSNIEDVLHVLRERMDTLRKKKEKS